MYTPTKEELEELGLKQDRTWEHHFDLLIKTGLVIWHSKKTGKFGISEYRFYPQSLEDIKTLIRLLTPNEN